MSTEIAEIKGSCHRHVGRGFEVIHEEATLHLTRFFNGKKRGANIQLTLSGTQLPHSYIHLTKEQCEELAEILKNCFNYEKYPSE